MAADDHELPDQPELTGLKLDDLDALYEAEAAIDPVGRKFFGIAHRLEYGEDAADFNDDVADSG